MMLPGYRAKWLSYLASTTCARAAFFCSVPEQTLGKHPSFDLAMFKLASQAIDIAAGVLAFAAQSSCLGSDALGA